MLGLGLFVVAVFVSSVSYFMWRDIPAAMDERWLAFQCQPVFNMMDGLMDLVWYLGYRDVHSLYNNIMESMHLPLPPPTDETPYEISNATFDNVGVRIYDWKGRASVPITGAVVFLHGGGYTNYHAHIFDEVCVDILYEVRVPIFSVDYRRAPEHKSPVQFEDCLAAVRYLMRESRVGGKLQHLRVDPNRLVIIGESSGGHMTASVVQQLVKPGASDGPMPKAAVLIYPVTQSLTLNTPSYLEYENGFLWKRKHSVWSFMAFHQGDCQDNFQSFQANNFSSYATRVWYADQLNLPQLKHRARDAKGNVIKTKDGEGDPAMIERFRAMYEDERNSPLLGDLSRFPATLVLSCEIDSLRDDAQMFVQRLRQLGRPVEHGHYNTVHGIISIDRDRRVIPANKSNQASFKPTNAQAMFTQMVHFINKEIGN